ncbi:MAG: FtsX-like permease family protein [Dehalococcoidia bacterium]
MRAVLRKLRHDLHANRLQRLFIVLLLTLATAALTTSLTVQARGGTAWEELFDEANGAHAWFYGSESALEDIGARPEVAARTSVYPVVRVNVPSVPTPLGDGFPLFLEGIGTEEPAIDRPVIVKGRWLAADGEVVLPRKFASDNGFGTGDSIQLSTPTGEEMLKVVGIAVFAGRSPYSLPALAWATPATVAEASAAGQHFSAMGIQLQSRGQVRAFEDLLNLDQLPGPGPNAKSESGVQFIEDWNGVRAQNDEATKVIVTFLGIFSLFALISAGFVIVNAIGGRVLARYRDIGLMKAIGFTPRQVASGLLIEQVGMAFIAVAAGIAAGTLLVPLLDDPASREFETRSLGYFRPGVAASVAAIVVGLVSAATLLPAWRASRVSAVRAIVFGSGSVSNRPSRVARTASRFGLPAWTLVGIKNAFDRPLRSWLTVCALVLSVVTLTFVVTSEWTIRQLLSNPALIGEPFELAVESPNTAALEAAIQADPSVETYFQRNTMAITPDGKDDEVNLAALGPGYEKVDWVVRKGRMFSAPGEAVVGAGFLDLMDADVGDTVTLAVLGKPLTLKIVGQYRATEDGGRWAMTSLETAREFDPSLQFTGFAVALKDHEADLADAERYRAAGATSIETFDHGADGVNGVRTVVGALGALLLAMGLVGLVNTLATGVRERRRDFAILKTVGFTPRQLTASILTGAWLLSIIALVIGIPLGVWVTMRISDFMGYQLGWGPGLFVRAPLAWLGAIVPFVLLSVFAAVLIPANSAARTRPNEGLRTE